MEWRVIKGFPIYEVSEFGDIRRIRTGKVLSPVCDRGYQLYRLCRGQERPAVRAHTLVLDAFVGPKPFAGAEACHNDGRRYNNHYTNLRWDTHQGNIDDMTVHGTNKKSDISAEDISEIKRRLALGVPQRAVAAQFSVGKSTIGRLALQR